MNSQIDGCIRHVVSRNTPRYWWHRTSLASERERAKQRRRFEDWWAEHPIDTPRPIHQIELGETPNLTG